MKKCENLNYEEMYKNLQKEMLYIQEQNDRKIEELNATKNAIINSLNEEIEFYKNVIKGILHIK